MSITSEFNVKRSLYNRCVIKRYIREPVRAYGNRVACARAPRRVTGQCADAHYMRARPTGLMH